MSFEVTQLAVFCFAMTETINTEVEFHGLREAWETH